MSQQKYENPFASLSVMYDDEQTNKPNDQSTSETSLDTLMEKLKTWRDITSVAVYKYGNYCDACYNYNGFDTDEDCGPSCPREVTVTYYAFRENAHLDWLLTSLEEDNCILTESEERKLFLLLENTPLNDFLHNVYPSAFHENRENAALQVKTYNKLTCSNVTTDQWLARQKEENEKKLLTLSSYYNEIIKKRESDHFLTIDEAFLLHINFRQKIRTSFNIHCRNGETVIY